MIKAFLLKFISSRWIFYSNRNNELVVSNLKIKVQNDEFLRGKQSGKISPDNLYEACYEENHISSSWM